MLTNSIEALCPSPSYYPICLNPNEVNQFAVMGFTTSNCLSHTSHLDVHLRGGCTLFTHGTPDFIPPPTLEIKVLLVFKTSFAITPCASSLELSMMPFHMSREDLLGNWVFGFWHINHDYIYDPLWNLTST